MTRGWSPLLCAAFGGESEACAHLVRLGAAVDKEDAAGRTALHLAAMSGGLDAVRVVLDAGAAPRKSNRFGLTPLHMAAQQGSPLVVRELAARCGVDALRDTDRDGRIPLHYAAESGRVDALTTMLSLDLQLASVADHSSQLAIHCAALEGHVEATEALLSVSGGCVLSEPDTTGATPLHNSVLSGNTALAELVYRWLPANHAAHARKDSQGRTALHLACMLPCACMARAVLNSLFGPASPPGHDADTHAASNHKAPPAAARQGRVELQGPGTTRTPSALGGKLRQRRQRWPRGADCPARKAARAQRRSALRASKAAGGAGDLHPAALLLARDGDGAAPVHYAAAWGSEETARLLVEYGSPADLRQVDGRTPLHLAAHGGHSAAVDLFLRHNADPDAANAYGLTPLHIASVRGNLACARLLVSCGADLAVGDRDRRTALHYAVEGRCHPVAALLLEAARGAAVSLAAACDSAGQTPLHYAADAGSAPLCSLLVAHGASLSVRDASGALPKDLARSQTLSQLLSDSPSAASP
ncbi:hypothetical protein DIPPA_20566 [Diplonema papillatum]|nr:hypothetical protein DIPPA_20566 [Diplonema papillatum]